jgi:large subunit ribosomal protein L1
MGKIGKRLKAASAAFEGKENLSVEDAVALVKANAWPSSTKASKSR